MVKAANIGSGNSGPWMTVFAAAVGSSLSFPVYTFYLFGLFIKPIAKEFSWGRGEVALALTFITYTTMLASPLFGTVVDRLGSKRVLVPSIIGFAVVTSSLYFLRPSLGWFYAVHVVLALVAIGTLPLTYTRVIVAWFEKNRGLALGLTIAGVGFGAAFYPPIVQHVMDLYGWRAGYPAIGVLMLVIALPVVTTFFREPSPTADTHAAKLITVGLTFREARREKSFWLLTAILILLGIVSSGTTTHIAALLSDRGLTPAGAAQGLIVLGNALIIGRIGAGLLLDRFNPPVIAFLIMTSAAAGLVLMASSLGIFATFCGIFLIGLGLGAEFDFLSFFIGRNLGMRAYGTIYGWIYAGFLLGSGLGSALVGFAFDHFGNYTYPMLMLAIAQAIAAVLFLGLSAPKTFASSKFEAGPVPWSVAD